MGDQEFDYGEQGIIARSWFGGRGRFDGGEEIQRWTAGRKAAVVLEIIKGKATAADAAKQFYLKYGYTKWRDDPHHLSISMKTIRTLGLA